MRVVGLSGTEVAPATAALGWALILGTAAAVFIGTLLLKPKDG